MAKQSFHQLEHSKLLKKFHTLCTLGKVSDDQKREMLFSYNVTSSRDLNVYELLELCGKLDKSVNTNPEEDRWRKRVIGAIGGYLRAIGKDAGTEYVKAAACRAASVQRFNAIPLERLRSLYNAFNQKKKDLQEVGKESNVIDMRQYLNKLEGCE